MNSATLRSRLSKKTTRPNASPAGGAKTLSLRLDFCLPVAFKFRPDCGRIKAIVPCGLSYEVSLEMSQAPLNKIKLKDLALHYVSRYATTRHKLATYLRRKVRERGWEGVSEAGLEAETGTPTEEAEAAISEVLELVDRIGAVNDGLFAEGRTRALSRRGMGANRIRQALAGAGIERGVADEALSELDALEAAVAFLRRRRWGPFGEGAPHDADARRKAFAAMMRAGHGPDLSGKLLRLSSEEELEQLRAERGG